MDYFISRARRIHGPTTEAEMRTWFAYGSLQPNDLVRRADETEWFPARLFPEIATADAASEEKSVCATAKTKAWKPGTTVQHDDYAQVAQDQRAGVVIWRLLSGFVCRPFTFWRTAGTACRSTVYRRAKDDRGFLLTWPLWIKKPVVALVVLHTVTWVGIAYWTAPRATSLFKTMVASAQDAWAEAGAELPPPANH